jgi:hypothetical protein
MSDAGSNSGIFRLCRKIPLLFAEKNLKTVCFPPLYLKHAHPPRRMGYLARNTRVASRFT